MNYQDLALCRFVYVHAMFFIFGLTSISPTAILGVIVVLEFLMQTVSLKSEVSNENFKNKHRAILLADIVVLACVLAVSRKVNIRENLILFAAYCAGLALAGTDVITLHRKHLHEDDLAHQDETYLQYMRRIWTSSVLGTLFFTCFFLLISYK